MSRQAQSIEPVFADNELRHRRRADSGSVGHSWIEKRRNQQGHGVPGHFVHTHPVDLQDQKTTKSYQKCSTHPPSPHTNQTATSFFIYRCTKISYRAKIHRCKMLLVQSFRSCAESSYCSRSTAWRFGEQAEDWFRSQQVMHGDLRSAGMAARSDRGGS